MVQQLYPNQSEAPAVHQEVGDLLAQAFAATQRDDPEVAAAATEIAADREQQQAAQAERRATKVEAAQPATAPETTSEAPASETQPDITADPTVQRLLRQTADTAVAEHERQREQEAQARQWEEYLEALPGDEYKRVTRSLAQEQARYQGTLQQVAAQVYTEGYTQVINTVPELKTLPAEIAQKVNASKTYGEVVNTFVDYAADQRAAKLAEPKAKEMFEAWKVKYQQDYTREIPKPLGTGGSAAAGATGGALGNFNPLDGSALLIAGFGGE